MTRAEMLQLSGAELVARLTQRGMGPIRARYAADRREEPWAEAEILRVLRQPRAAA